MPCPPRVISAVRQASSPIAGDGLTPSHAVGWAVPAVSEVCRQQSRHSKKGADGPRSERGVCAHVAINSSPPQAAPLPSSNTCRSASAAGDQYFDFVNGLSRLLCIRSTSWWRSEKGLLLVARPLRPSRKDRGPASPFNELSAPLLRSARPGLRQLSSSFASSLGVLVMYQFGMTIFPPPRPPWM